jgi:hypothetical protein
MTDTKRFLNAVDTILDVSHITRTFAELTPDNTSYLIPPDSSITLSQAKERISSMELEAAFHEWLSFPQQLRADLRQCIKERMANEAGMTLK